MSAVLSVSEIIAALEAPHENILQLSSAELAKLFVPDVDDELVGRVTELRSLPGRVPKSYKVRRKARRRKPKRIRRFSEAARSGA